MARPFFARDRISDFEIFEMHVAKTLSILSTNKASGQPTEVQDLFSRFSIDVASEFLFGKNLDTLSASHPIPGKSQMGPKGSATTDLWGSFAGAFEMAQLNVTARARIGYLWPLFELFGDKSQQHVKIIQDWLDPLVKRSGAEKTGITGPIADKTFLEHLVDSTEGMFTFKGTHGGFDLMLCADTTLIRDQLLSMLLAARDTVCTFLLFCRILCTAL